MSELTALSSHPAALRLSFVLLHFVWQGFAVALAAAMLLLFLHTASSHLRYVVLLALFVVMLALPVVTFLCSARASSSTPITTHFLPPARVAPLSPTPVGLRAPAASRALAKSPRVPLRWVPAIWAAGVCVLSLRLLCGAIGLHLARRRAAGIADAEWRARLTRLAAALGLARRVDLLLSAGLRSPTLVGWLRPAILLPVNVLSGLTSEQLEMILAHELAHLRRADYLVNLLQTVAETLLFYHPAVWWLSRRLRLEREQCCDDLAVAVCGDALAYAHALAALGDLPAPQLLVTAGGDLSARVHRLLRVRPPRRPGRPAWLAAAAALAAVAALGAGLQRPTVAAAAKTATRVVRKTTAREIAAASAVYAPSALAAPAAAPKPAAPRPPAAPTTSTAPRTAAPPSAPAADQVVYDVIPLTYLTPATLAGQLGVPIQKIDLTGPPFPSAPVKPPTEKAGLADLLPPGITFFGAAAPEAHQLLIAGKPEAVAEFAAWVKLIDRKPQQVMFALELHTSLPQNGRPLATAEPEDRYRYFALPQGVTQYAFGSSDRVVQSFRVLTFNLLPVLDVASATDPNTGAGRQGMVDVTPRVNGDGTITVILSAGFLDSNGPTKAGTAGQSVATVNLHSGEPVAISLPEVGRVAVLTATLVKEQPSG